jgi:broad specificity phosphatase PhoE
MGKKEMRTLIFPLSMLLTFNFGLAFICSLIPSNRKVYCFDGRGLAFPVPQNKHFRVQSCTTMNVHQGPSLQERDFQSTPLRESNVPKLGALRNIYIGLRHGESFGNVLGVISSHPVQGTLIHGLTEMGREQARSASTELLHAIGGTENIKDLLIFTSNFTRARETAAELVKALSSITGNIQTKDILIEPALRERWFGDLDDTIITNYNKVWPADLKDAACTNYGVESVDQVCERLRSMLVKIEANYVGRRIVLVSHADTLQILQTYLALVDTRTFSQYRFKNGEVRLLCQDPASLPDPVPLIYSP